MKIRKNKFHKIPVPENTVYTKLPNGGHMMTPVGMIPESILEDFSAGKYTEDEIYEIYLSCSQKFYEGNPNIFSFSW
ncbi:hypothetical protein KKF34_13735 [Myxococcota bacterium]|nr:hypothetical protein [Myxococcota bacterium]MBU1379243.1 hypothetical protein [Myxococcota bacterium]MBU1497932.1 hypothetical protein [Myxococcota bacterium]